MKGTSKPQSRNIKVEEYCNCLFGAEYQKECDDYVMKQNNHDMYLQKYVKLQNQLLVRNVDIQMKLKE